MLVLSAALAFAITMLILSMVTNVIVETIHRLIRMRQKGLSLMLGHLFDRVIAPLVPDATLDAAAKNNARTAFVEMMTINRSPAGTALVGVQSVVDKDAGFALWPWDGRRLDKLPIEAFMSRLGGSDYSDVIRMLGANSAAGVEGLLGSIAQKFQEFGDEASTFFQRRARFLAVVVSMFVAWFVYVQPYEIFATFMADPAVAQRVIDMQEPVMTEAMAKYVKEPTDSATDANKSTESTENTANIESANDDPAKVAAEAKVAVKAYIDQLTTAGVPIGWTAARLKANGFKLCRVLGINIPVPDLSGKPCGTSDATPVTAATPATAVTPIPAKPIFTTILWLLLGGLLVGLGGPFWFDMVKSLSSIRSVLGAGTAAVAPVAAGNPAVPVTAVDHFMTSAAGRDAATGAAAGEQDDEPDVG